MEACIMRPSLWFILMVASRLVVRLSSISRVSFRCIPPGPLLPTDTVLYGRAAPRMTAIPETAALISQSRCFRYRFAALLMTSAVTIEAITDAAGSALP